MPESVRPSLPNEAALDVAWTDATEPALSGVRVFHCGDLVAVLVHRGELWDAVVVRPGAEPPVELGVLKGDEVVDSLNNLL